ncbi:ATP-binding protein [Streptomyces sparsogenes]|uniref:Regulatory protein n=1 Tax=Streptomyces sparsogenes DSM 40356 TaxID=1331668 RepID=A0A1R1SNA3_9ACTN|nr:ATP-binding protein [Streptomyces sparsogenes]OMI39469.1 regulatory protein [Streptomyces sparsogenes DSM 40356]
MQVLQVQMEVRPDPAEVSRARRWARSRLAGSGIGVDEPLAETLILLISELVTNAVVHTGCPAVLRMLFPAQGEGGGPGAGGRGGRGPGCGTVRVEVADTSDRAPRRRCASEDATNGRGLELVDGLADRWGWHPEGAGKRIWCEVDRGARGGLGAYGTHEDVALTGRTSPHAPSQIGRSRQSPDQVLT